MTNVQSIIHSVYAGAIGIGIQRFAGSAFAIMRSGKAAPGRFGENSADVVKTTIGPNTITVDEFKAAMYKRNCSGADRTDTTPTAAQIVASLPKCQVDDQWKFVIYNNGTANVLTLAGGTGVTVVGVATTGFGKTKEYRVKITAVTPIPTVEVMSLGTDSTI